MPDPIDDANLRRLKDIAERIKVDAAGRICGDCQFYKGGECSKFEEWAAPVLVYTPMAVACSKHAAH